jgi:hypothetical protein
MTSQIDFVARSGITDKRSIESIREIYEWVKRTRAKAGENVYKGSYIIPSNSDEEIRKKVMPMVIHVCTYTRQTENLVRRITTIAAAKRFPLLARANGDPKTIARYVDLMRLYHMATDPAYPPAGLPPAKAERLEDVYIGQIASVLANEKESATYGGDMSVDNAVGLAADKLENELRGSLPLVGVLRLAERILPASRMDESDVTIWLTEFVRVARKRAGFDDAGVIAVALRRLHEERRTMARNAKWWRFWKKKEERKDANAPPGQRVPAYDPTHDFNLEWALSVSKYMDVALFHSNAVALDEPMQPERIYPHVSVLIRDWKVDKKKHNFEMWINERVVRLSPRLLGVFRL